MLRGVVNWLFRPERGPAVPAQAPVGAHDADDLGARLSRLESQMTAVSLQWTETLDKLQAWTNRQNARDAKRTQAGLSQLAANSHEDAPGTTIPGATVPDIAEVKMQLRKRLQAQNGR